MGKKNRKPNKGVKPARHNATAAEQSTLSPAQVAGKPRQALTNVKRRTILKSTAAVGVLIGGGVLIQFYDNKSRNLHDLTSIGSGQPMVVQVHDPSCALCRRLKSNTLEALDQIEGVQYRIADLTSSEGRAMAEEYGVGKVTLLLFNARGKHIDTVQGVTPVNKLLDTFTRRFI
jgi:thioredoxin-like negative regulator of GroEL